MRNIPLMSTGKITIPRADSRPLRYRPLLRSLTARTHNTPNLLPSAWWQHGFKVNISAAAGKTRTDSMWIEFFHRGYCSSIAIAAQGLYIFLRP